MPAVGILPVGVIGTEGRALYETDLDMENV